MALVGLEMQGSRLNAARVRKHAIGGGDDIGFDGKAPIMPRVYSWLSELTSDRNSGRVASVTENAQHPAGDEVGAALADAAVDHAMMRRLDDHGDAAGLQYLFDRVGDLRREPLLNLQPLGENLDHARELGNAHTLLSGM